MGTATSHFVRRARAQRGGDLKHHLVNDRGQEEEKLRRRRVATPRAAGDFEQKKKGHDPASVITQMRGGGATQATGTGGEGRGWKRGSEEWFPGGGGTPPSQKPNAVLGDAYAGLTAVCKHGGGPGKGSIPVAHEANLTHHASRSSSENRNLIKKGEKGKRGKEVL